MCSAIDAAAIVPIAVADDAAAVEIAADGLQARAKTSKALVALSPFACLLGLMQLRTGSLTVVVVVVAAAVAAVADAADGLQATAKTLTASVA